MCILILSLVWCEDSAPNVCKHISDTPCIRNQQFLLTFSILYLVGKAPSVIRQTSLRLLMMIKFGPLFAQTVSLSVKVSKCLIYCFRKYLVCSDIFFWFFDYTFFFLTYFICTVVISIDMRIILAKVINCVQKDINQYITPSSDPIINYQKKKNIYSRPIINLMLYFA